MTTRDIVISTIRQQFPLYDGELLDSTTAMQVSGWDSFSHVELMFALEDALGCSIDIAETFELANIGELIAYATAKVGNQDA